MEIEKRELYNFIVEEDFNGGYKVIKGPLIKNNPPCKLWPSKCGGHPGPYNSGPFEIVFQLLKIQNI